MNISNNRQKVHKELEGSQKDHLQRIKRFITQPSIALENNGVYECADLLRNIFCEIGITETEVIQTPGFPAVWAHYKGKSEKTLAIYSYYDTNVIGDNWSVPPYEGIVEKRDPFKKVLYGRGAINKGGLIALLNTLETLLDIEGVLPLNLMFIIEGDEFLGSNQIPFLINKFESKLNKSDALLVPQTCQTINGDVTIYLGNKGCLHLELKCSGDLWGKGPVGGSIHSSTQCIVDHPVWRLVSALNTLYDHEKNIVLVDGFYDKVEKPGEEDLALINILAEKYKGLEADAIPALGGSYRIKQFINEERGVDLIKRFSYSPTMNINGIRAGFTGPGTLLWTLPHEAFCTIDIRLPYDMDPFDIMNKIRGHLDTHGFSDITITPLETSSAEIPISTSDDIFKASLRVFDEWNIKPVIWPRRGSGGPTGFFSKMLGLKSLSSTGFSYASGHSGPDEYMVVEGNDKVGGLLEFEKSLADLIYSFAYFPDPF